MSQPSIKILHIFGRMDRGGAEMRTLETMRHIDKKRFIFEFCALSGLPGALDDEIRALGGKVHYLPRDFQFIYKFIKLLQRERFAVIHSHVYHFSGFLLFLAATIGVPVRIAHFRTVDRKNDGLLRSIYRRVMKYAISRYATNILAVNHTVMRNVWSWPDPRCQVIYNGFDFSRFAVQSDQRQIRRDVGVAQDSLCVIHVGNMTPAKNHLRLLVIFTKIVQLVAQAQLLLVGKPCQETVEIMRNCSVNDKIIIAGVRSDVPNLLRAADLTVFPSLWEGLPGAVIEACAAGLPVLASDLPGIAEIVAFFPNLQCLDLARSDEEWAKVALQLHRRGRYRVEPEKSPFAITATIHQWESLYENAF